MSHTFAVPVYGAAPGLVSLVDSLRAQSTPGSAVVLTTSTPSPELESFARRSALPLHVNPRRLDIASDWNFALAAARTELVTLAHQDDRYAPDYVTQLAAALGRHPGASLAFCDYVEHTPLGPRATHLNLVVKRYLRRRAFGSAECLTGPRDKLRLLSLGNPICCPSVMLNRATLGDFSFPAGFRTNLDWMAWLGLARRPGGFVYVRQRLLSKGVHAASETTATIADRTREREDRAVFETLWPGSIAALLAGVYRLGYLANRVDGSARLQADAHDPDSHEDDADPLQR